MWLWLVLGIVVGSLVSNVIFYARTGHGILKIDRTNPAKDLYSLELGNLDDLPKKKRITLTIKTVDSRD